MLKVTDTKGRSVCHIPVSCQHNTLEIIRRKNGFLVCLLKDVPVNNFILFLPFRVLCQAGNGKGKDDIGMLLPETQRLNGCKGIKSKRASAEKTSVTFIISSTDTKIKII